MRWDLEIPMAAIVTNYLRAIVDTAIQADCMIVDFTDPMSLDAAHRVVIACTRGSTDADSPGNGEITVETTIKSLWAQATLQADFSAHFARVNEVRDKLMPSDLVDRLNAFAPSGLVIDYVQPKRDFDTSIKVDTWIVGTFNFVVNYHQTVTE